MDLDARAGLVVRDDVDPPPTNRTSRWSHVSTSNDCGPFTVRVSLLIVVSRSVMSLPLCSLRVAVLTTGRHGVDDTIYRVNGHDISRPVPWQPRTVGSWDATPDREETTMSKRGRKRRSRKGNAANHGRRPNA
ncbi:hypothetical protein GCM10025865_22270 [Paraoerskovia sediminicola]|uniref:Uncharacterized protein n=1 Tax=Paraoerskovia sediminicola TaxID=1138587 RepID=A0ABN6XDA6_9CELL|nr:hypothetical protein GCM10025865_22270 [Paraoerskovia sediminicola]